jgi:uncharacterized membrane protein
MLSVFIISHLASGAFVLIFIIVLIFFSSFFSPLLVSCVFFSRCWLAFVNENSKKNENLLFSSVVRLEAHFYEIYI